MRINLEFNDRDARRAFNALLRAGQDLTPIMIDIGEELINSTRERFNTEEDPDGAPWTPLSEISRSRKVRNPDQILTEFGDLRRDIVYQAGRDYVDSSRI